MSRLSNYINFIKMILLKPKLLFSQYDSCFNNYVYSDTINLFTHNILKEYLLEEILDELGLQRPVVDIDYKKNNRNGSVSAYKLRIIVELVLAKKPKTLLEIGTFEGRTTFNLAKNLKDQTQIFAMNLPQNQCNFEVGKFFKDTEFSKHITQIYADSTKYDFSCLPSFDFVFIDGGHDYDTVLKDSINVYQKLNPNGIILWDDVDLNHLGSTQAIFDFCKKYDLDMKIISGASAAITWRER